MPRIVDHDARRRELTEALFTVAARDGFSAVSLRSVAIEAGWSTGALRHYLPTRQHLIDAALGSLSDRVAARVGPRIRALERCDDAEVARYANELLEELLPLDAERQHEMAVWLAVTVPSGDEALARWRAGMFFAIRHVCRRVVARLRGVPPPPDVTTQAADLSAAAANWRPLADPDHEARASALHATLDGLAMHAFSGVDRRSVHSSLDRLLRDLGGLDEP